MTATLLCFVLIVASEDAKPLVLLAETDEYKAAKAEEIVFEGVVENNPGDGGVGKPARFNAYRLKGKAADGKEFVRELYVPGKAFLLASSVGKRVKIKGKPVDTTAEGATHAELWPGFLEEAALAAVEPPKTDGVLARCTWQPEEARRAGKRTYVFRSGREAARALRLTGADAAEAATALLADKLGVPLIDWDKQMVVCLTVGLRGGDADRLTVTRATVQNKTLSISYRLTTAANGGGFSYPAETVLVERFNGEVKVEEEPAAK
jgi:hypothetical protein